MLLAPRHLRDEPAESRADKQHSGDNRRNQHRRADERDNDEPIERRNPDEV